MVVRKDSSVLENKWHDAQRVDQTDMNVEQQHTNETDASIIQNHFGSGVLPASPTQVVLFDSDLPDTTQAALLAAGDFDGTGLSVATQPSDQNLGNQLEIELSDSLAFGRLSVKVAIIGLAFDDTVQSERLYFYRNEKQVTARHYKKILTFLTNDFKGNNNCSRALGGRLVIRETKSFQLSRDPIMVAQDVQPNLFWRDFKLADLGTSLANTLQAGMGDEFSVDALDINTTGLPYRTLEVADVTTQIGQKFKATTNNIQKITLLLGVAQDGYDVTTEFDWAGDLVVSIYALQTTVNSPTDIVPSLAIDFDPAFVPLAQISYNQTTLQEYGYVLNNVPQPVDFVFSSTAVASVASNGVIQAGKYYAVTVKRSGAATGGTLFLAGGTDKLEDSRLTVFSGVWVDVPEEDLWFQVWTDAAKISDGQGYDNGNGMQFSKTAIDEETGSTIDYQAVHYPLADTGESVLNTGVLQAILEESVPVQDERTGNPINSRQRFVPSFSFVNSAALESLKSVSEPLVIGGIQDINPKINPILEKTQALPGLAKGDTFCIVNPDPDLLSLNLLGSKLVPNSDVCNEGFKIFKVTLCTDGYGDVNGDGTIDLTDVALAATLIGESVSSPISQQKIIDGEFTTLELLRADVDGDGYVTSNDVDLISQYVARQINAFPVGSWFQHMCLQVQNLVGRNDGYYDCSVDGYVRLDGYNGANIVSADSLTPDELLYDGYIVTPVIDLDSAFTTTPFESVQYRIEPLPFWQPYLLMVNSEARLVPTTFTEAAKVPDKDCSTPVTFKCADKNEVVPACDPGRNDFFVPDNLIIGRGQILNPDGTNHSIDFEIGTIILQLPESALSESAINVFDKFVADAGAGFTAAGYPCMRYADCTTVQSTDLALGRVKFNVSIQSFSPNLDGYDTEDGYVLIVDDTIGVYMDQTTGILKLTIADLIADAVYKTLITKIQITVYLKKAGWNNGTLTISPAEIAGLISS